MIGEICSALSNAAIEHGCFHDCVHVSLPGGFGSLEIKAWSDGDHSIQLLDGDFHTHLDLLADEYKLEPVEAFVLFVRKLLSGELFLIEETSADGVIRRTIEESLEAYLPYVEKNCTYRVVNEAQPFYRGDAQPAEPVVTPYVKR
ncbi:hypothetical protein [Paucibacter sp. XJ19-41]|uniref:hypothetical protein n=1 Tax=Paucibacter sp. XJ19-41 TaxID=2927824 RepID=UPI00234B3B56|nr:hypothetical protein [Paucibacter sp. XJ19-41]MDC6170816.1 hypothetical protein [Paucibacter sp. XJ19-41]